MKEPMFANKIEDFIDQNHLISFFFSQNRAKFEILNISVPSLWAFRSQVFFWGRQNWNKNHHQSYYLSAFRTKALSLLPDQPPPPPPKTSS